MTEAELVEQLARLPDEKRRDVTKAAAVARQRRVQIAIQQVRKTLLAGFRDRKAARAIDDAVCGRRTGSDPALRSAIAQQLRGTLAISTICQAHREFANSLMNRKIVG